MSYSTSESEFGPTARGQGGQGDQASSNLAIVVGFNGSKYSLAALNVAIELVRSRNGHLEIVYVRNISGKDGQQSPTRGPSPQLIEQLVRDVYAKTSALADGGVSWRFRHHEGATVDQLLLAAIDLRGTMMPQTPVLITVGAGSRFDQSTASDLWRKATEEHLPCLIVPLRADAPVFDNGLDAISLSSVRSAIHEVVVHERKHAETVLRHAGYSTEEIDYVLAGLTFPLPLTSLEDRAAQFGIFVGSLTDRLGGSP